MAKTYKKLFTGRSITFATNLNKIIDTFSIGRVSFGNNSSELLEKDYTYDDTNGTLDVAVDFAGSFLVTYTLKDNPHLAAIKNIAADPTVNQTIIGGGGGGGGSSETLPHVHGTFHNRSNLTGSYVYNKIVVDDGIVRGLSSRSLSLSSLGDVDLVDAADNDMLFRSGGNWIDTDGLLTWNGSNLHVEGTIDLNGGEEISWNNDFHTLNIPTGTGSTLQVGQEFYFLIYNDTGAQIDNGQVVKPVGGFLVGGEVLPTVILAQADNHETCEGTLFMATSNIAIGATGMATRLGRVNADTSGMAGGANLYLSPTVAGGYTDVRPEFPDYTITLGGVINPATEVGGGIIGFNVTRNVQDTILNAWDGGFREGFDFTVSAVGSVITGTLERKGGGDLTMIFHDGLTTFDCTPAATIVLTAGTDTNPQENFVYIPLTTKVLTVSTSSFPSDEHIKVANVLLQSATATIDGDALSNRNWNDHIKTTDDNGHLLHIAERLRQLPASWLSGTEGALTLDTVPTPDDVFVTVTGGNVYQLHKQTFPSFDTEVSDHFHVVNNLAEPYVKETNLNTQLLDALGNSLNNRSFSFVLWGVQNKSGEESNLMINLPIGSYAYVSPDDAESDALNYSVYTIPSEFNGNGFLIARFTCTYKNNDWTVEATEDLRGRIPNSSAGGGAGGTGVTTFLGLTDVPNDYTTFGSYFVKVAAGETGLEFVAGGGGASPLTTKGDVYTYDTADARLPVSGNNGWVLSEDSTEATGLKWIALAGGGDMLLNTVQTVTAIKTFNNATFVLRNVADTFDGSFINTNTADRVYTLQDAAGTLAFTSDIPTTSDYVPLNAVVSPATWGASSKTELHGDGTQEIIFGDTDLFTNEWAINKFKVRTDNEVRLEVYGSALDLATSNFIKITKGGLVINTTSDAGTDKLVSYTTGSETTSTTYGAAKNLTITAGTTNGLANGTLTLGSVTNSTDDVTTSLVSGGGKVNLELTSGVSKLELGNTSITNEFRAYKDATNSGVAILGGNTATQRIILDPNNVIGLGATTGILVFDSAQSVGLYYELDYSTNGAVLGGDGALWIPPKGYNDITYAPISVVGTVTAVTGGTAISSTGGATPELSLDNTAVTPAAYTNADITIDAQGRITAAASGSGGGTGTVTNVNDGAGMTFTAITTTGDVVLGTPSTLTAATTNAVTADSHTHAITGFSETGHTHAAGIVNEIQTTDGSGAFTAGGILYTSDTLYLGLSTAGGLVRSVLAQGSATDIQLSLTSKGAFPTTIAGNGASVSVGTSGTGDVELIPSSGNDVIIRTHGSLLLGLTLNTTGTNRDIKAEGAETNIGVTFTPKGTGVLKVPTGYEANVSADVDLVNKKWIDDQGFGGGGLGGSIANTQVAYGSGTDITGSAALTFSGNTLAIASNSDVAPQGLTINNAGNQGSVIKLTASGHSTTGFWIRSLDSGNVLLQNIENAEMAFHTNNTERVVIPAGGLAAGGADDVVTIDATTHELGTVTQASLGGGEPTENIIFTATKTSGQNINGVEGTENNLTWDVVTQDTGEITSFSSGGFKVQFSNAGWVNIHASAYITNGLMNNRTMIGIRIEHRRADTNLYYSYQGDMQYNRDDAAAYDSSGGSVSQNMMYVASGDYIYITSRIFDDGTSGTTQTFDTTYSKLRIARIEF